MTQSDSETPDTTVGNVEGDVNVGGGAEETPAEDAPADGDTTDGDTSGDEAQQDTGALQE